MNRIFLNLIAVSQIVLGIFTLVMPEGLFLWMGLSAPPADNHYMLGMLAARFLAIGGLFIWVAQLPRPPLSILIAMLAIQALDILSGLIQLMAASVSLQIVAFPMFNATFFVIVLGIIIAQELQRRSGAESLS